MTVPLAAAAIGVPVGPRCRSPVHAAPAPAESACQRPRRRPDESDEDGGRLTATRTSGLCRLDPGGELRALPLEVLDVLAVFRLPERTDVSTRFLSARADASAF